jgi:hypothetical protein
MKLNVCTANIARVFYSRIRNDNIDFEGELTAVPFSGFKEKSRLASTIYCALSPLQNYYMITYVFIIMIY